MRARRTVVVVEVGHFASTDGFVRSASKRAGGRHLVGSEARGPVKGELGLYVSGERRYNKDRRPLGAGVLHVSHGKKDKQSLEEAVGREGTGFPMQSTMEWTIPF